MLHRLKKGWSRFWLRLTGQRLFMRIVFKNGHVEEFQVSKFTTTGGLRSLEWTDADASYMLHAAKMEEIVAIISVRR